MGVITRSGALAALTSSASQTVGTAYGRLRAARLKSTLAQPLPFPRRMAIEPASACNLECPMCPTPSKSRKNGIMPLATFQRIIDEIAPHGLDELFLHLWGEPLIHPHVAQFAAYAKQHASIKRIVMSTNATLLNAKRGEALLRSGLDYLVLSLDGATAPTYEKLRLGARYDATMANVAAFLQQRSEIGQGPHVVFQIIAMKDTQDEIEAFRNRWRPLLQPGDEISVKPFNNWSDHEGSLAKPGVPFRSPCTAFLWEFLAIAWNGTVVPCCFDCEAALTLGNVHEQTLAQIWNGPQLRQMRQDHLNLDFSKQPLCNACDNTTERLDSGRLMRMLGNRTQTHVSDPAYSPSRD